MKKDIYKNKTFFILLSIFLLSSFIRIIYLDKIPSGINTDEAAYIYDAKSFIETGKDKWGRAPEITISEYGSIDHRSPLYIWLQIPLVKILGANEWSARLPSAILGSLTVLLTYFLSRQFFSKKIAILSSFLLAISPWHIFISRVGLECNVLPFFFVLSFLILIKGVNSGEKKWPIYLSSALFAASMYGYSVNKIFVPLFLLAFFAINKDWIKKNRNTFTFSLVLFILFITPLVSLNITQYLSQQGRFNEISIFKDIFDAPILFSLQYLSFFTIGFFFPSAKTILESNMLPITFGKIYIFEVIFLTLGIVFLYNRKKEKNMKILLAWLLLYPIAAALTHGGVLHAFRATTAFPIFEMLIAFGIVEAMHQVKKTNMPFFRKALPWFFIIAFINIGFFFWSFFTKYPESAAKHFEYGNKEALYYVKNLKLDSDIVITEMSLVPNIVGQNFIYTLLYLDYSPSRFQNTHINYTETSNPGWSIIKSFDKYYFGNVEEEYAINPKRIFIVRENELKNIIPKKIINFPNGEIAFKIIYNE